MANQIKNLLTTESLENRFSKQLSTNVLSFNLCLNVLEKLYVLKEQKNVLSRATYYRFYDEFWCEFNDYTKLLNDDYYDSFSYNNNLQTIFSLLLEWKRNFTLFSDGKRTCKVYVSTHKRLIKNLIYSLSFFDNKLNDDINYETLSNDLIDRLIDRLIDTDGLGAAINFLAYNGYTKKDMIDVFKFNQSDVESYFKNNIVLTPLKSLLKDSSVKWTGRIHLVNFNAYEQKHWSSSPTYMTLEQVIKDYGDNLSWYEEEVEEDNVHCIINVLTDEELDEFGHRKEVK